MQALQRSLLLFWVIAALSPSTQAQQAENKPLRLAIYLADSLQNQAGAYETAIGLLEEALSKAQRRSADTAITAQIHHKLGVNFFYTDQFDKAIHHSSTAITLRQAYLGNQHADTQNSLFLRAAINRWIGQFDQAVTDLKTIITALRQSPELSPSTKDSLLAIRYEELGVNYLSLGDYPLAHSYLENAKQRYQAQYGSQHPYYLQASAQQAVALEGMGQYKQAIDQHQAVLSNYESHSADPLDIAVLCTNLGLAYAKNEQYQQAAAFTERAISSYIALNDTALLAEAYSNLSGIYAQLNQLEKATTAYQQGLALASTIFETPYHPLFGELHTHRATIALHQQDPNSALAYTQKAIQALVPNHTGNDRTDLPAISQNRILSKYELLEPLQAKATAHLQLYQSSSMATHLENALATYQTLDTLIVAIRSGYMVEESKFLLLEKARPIYEEAIQAALPLHERHGQEKYLEQAYAFSARNKAIVLIDGLQHNSALEFGNIPKEQLAAERTLKQQIYKLELKIYEAQQTGNSNNVQTATADLLKIRQSYERLLQKLEAEFPVYYQLKYAFTELPTIDQIQNALPAKSLLMEYFIGEEQLFIFRLSPTSALQCFSYPKPKGFDTSVQHFRHYCSDISGETELAGEGQQLLEWLVAEPPQGQTAQQLIIVPDGQVAQMAFSALPALQADKRYLIEDYAFSYAFSTALLFTPTAKPTVAPQLFGGFGITYDPFTLAAIEEKGITLYESSEPERAGGQLEFSDDEVLEIADLLNGKAWTNQAATRHTFLEEAHQFRLLHLAMHAAMDAQQPLNSALIFTKLTDSTEFLLRMTDLYALSLNAELVALSACNTGAGHIQPGEGVRTIARAFQYAGARSLVASLWSASDESTKTIMLDFYRHLKKGEDKAQALRLAQLDYLAAASPEYSKPAFWSHLILTGETAPVEMRKFEWWWFIVLLIAITASAVWFALPKSSLLQ